MTIAAQGVGGPGLPLGKDSSLTASDGAGKMRQWRVAIPATGLEGIVANKDKGGKSNKKVPSKNLKEKRQEKKAKRDASDKRQSKIT